MGLLKPCLQAAREGGCLVPVSSLFWSGAVRWTPCLEQGCGCRGQPGSTPPLPSDH